MDRPVVVWFEDADTCADALVYAAREARVRQAPLRLVRPARRSADRQIDGFDLRDERRTVPDSLGAAAARLCAAHPGLAIETVEADGDPAELLTRASRDASLLVVAGPGSAGSAGSAGPAGPGARQPDTTAFRVLAQAVCPVTVVRGELAPAIRRIVVGIDVDSPRDSSALVSFAVAEGLLHGAEVYAIHVWEDPERLYGTDAQHIQVGHTSLHESHHDRLAAILEPWERKHPDMIITREVFPGSPGHLLVAATRLMDTLVIGGHVRSEALSAADSAAGMRIGALAQTVLRHARCPVAMVPVG